MRQLPEGGHRTTKGVTSGMDNAEARDIGCGLEVKERIKCKRAAGAPVGFSSLNHYLRMGMTNSPGSVSHT